MVRSREYTQKHSTRHAVTTLLVRAALPTSTIKVPVMGMIVGRRKEAAP